MRHLLTTVSALLFVASLSAQSAPDFWKRISESQLWLPENAETVTLPDEYLMLSLDFEAMRAHLAQAPEEGSAAARSGAVKIRLPMPDGTMEVFKVWKSSVMHPDLAARYPNIQTFAGQGITNPTHTVRLGYGPTGFHAIVPSENGGATIFPIATNQSTFYVSCAHSDYIWKGLNVPPVRVKYEKMEGATPILDNNEPSNDEQISLRGGGEGAPAVRRDYLFALACTGEYGSSHGGTKELVLASLVEATNALNSVVERDADMRLILIPGIESIIFLNAATDPYTNSNMGGALLGQNEDVLNQIIGLENFDVGHVFTNGCTDVGGVVSGSVCSAGKARGVTCHFSSNVVAITLSIAAHEMGHQYTGGHTFNHCPGSEGQHHSGSAYEPGSGSTILSYQGACGPSNISGAGNLHYNGGTVEEFWFYTHLSGGNFCPNKTTTSNTSPAVSLSYTDGFYIPIRTPFELEATASDADGDPLTYCWEQVNLGPSVPLGQPAGTSPLFRSLDPTTNPVRVFPRLNFILNNSGTIEEVLPTYTRNLKMRCTVRDNNISQGAGGITWKDVSFEATASAGPFLVTNPNNNSVVWKAGQEVTVEWDVANTDNNLVRCYSVNILLSTDGGLTWPHKLAGATPNDGSETVFVPDVTSTTARIRVEAAENIFFDLSNQNFQIQPADVPSYTLSVGPQWQQVCVPEDAAIEVNTAAVQGYDAPISFDIAGALPAGATYSFTKNPVMPGESTAVILDMENVTADGPFELDLVVTSDTTTVIRKLYFNIVYNDFSALALQTPVSGSTDQGLLPEFTWTNLSHADVYDFQLSTDPTFPDSAIIDEAFNLAGGAYTPDVALKEGTIYYWRIAPSNACGRSPYTSPATFKTYIIACQPFQSSDVPVNIPAVGTPTIESSLPIISSGTITDINVANLKGSHDALPHIQASLTSPAGTEVVLFSGVCGNVGEFNLGLNDEAPFDILCPPINGLVYRPQNPLSAFDGENTLGNWKMKIKVINSDGQGGVLQNWRLEFCSSVTPVNPLVVKNDTLPVPPNDSRIIHNFHLAAIDPGVSPTLLQITIVKNTDYGFVSKSGVQLGIGDRFTMDDINAGRVTYTNTDPTALYDNFTFIVENASGGFVGTPKFNIKMDPDAPTDAEEVNLSETIFLFPNPASNALHVAFQEAPVSNATLLVTDLQGRLVNTQQLLAGQSLATLPVGDFPTGIYFLNVRTANGVLVKKFVVQR